MSLPGAVLPWVTQQFLDDDGEPLAGGSVYFYEVGTTTPKNTYNNADLDPAHANANPVVLDAAGRATVFLAPDGYDVVVKDADGNTIRSLADVEDIGLTFLAGLGTTFSEGSKNVDSGYTVLVTDQLVTVTNISTTDPCIINLPAASARVAGATTNGLPLWIKNLSAQEVAITPNGSDTIDGALGAYTLAVGASALFPCVQLVSDGVSAWYVIGGLGM